MATITVNVDQELADRFNEADEQKRLKMEAFIMVSLLDFESDRADESEETIFELMQRVGEEAQARGLTPEIFEELLRDG